MTVDCINLDDLADTPVWVAWVNEQRGDKLTKVPYAAATGSKAAANDQSTWALREAALKHAEKIVNGLGGGIGIMLGVDCGDGTRLGGIDLDTCLDEAGNIADWAREVVARLASYTEVSPSLTGLKVFFRYRGDDLPRLRELMGRQHGRMFKRPGDGDHPPAIELHISNRYFAVTKDGIDPELTDLRLVDSADLEWLIREAGPAFVAGPEQCVAAGPAASRPHDQSRSGAAFRLGQTMRRAGADFEAFRDAVQTDPDTASWYAEKGAANGQRELHRIWEKAEALTKGVGLDDFHAYMPTHSYLFAPSGEMWPASSVNARIAPIPTLNDDGSPKLDDRGKPITITAAAWLDRNRPVEQMSWIPGEEQIIADRLTSHAGWIERQGARVFNLYRGPAIVRGNANSAIPWLRHLRRVYPAEHLHLVRYLAHRVQRPGDKINHAIVLGGAQGIGKDTLLEPVKQGVGPWNWHEISPADLTRQFNGFARSVVLRINEGHDLGEINRYQFYEHVKVYTAAPPDVLRVNEKHLREYYVTNCCSVIITTNHKTDGVYLPADDRRHYVAWSNVTKEDFTPEYWERLWQWYGGGGFGHVAAHLAEMDISDFDPKAPPPKTDAWWAIVDAGRPSEDADLVAVLDRLKNPDAFILDDLVKAAPAAFADWLRDRKNPPGDSTSIGGSRLRSGAQQGRHPRRLVACGRSPAGLLRAQQSHRA
jgi:hypothetical protein